MTQLVTGEAVVVDISTAGVPSRILAALIDLAAQGGLLFVLSMLVGAFAPVGSDAAVGAVVIVVLVLIWLGYPVLLETLLSGRTLGKMALGLRVVRDDGGPIRFRHAITRGLLGMFVEKPGMTFGSAGLITALLNDRSKRLGDLLAGTIVVQERVAAPRHDMVFMPPGLAGWAALLDLSALPDDLAGSARSFLSRFPSLTPAAQADLGGRIATAVAQVVTPAPPPGVPPWAYLSAVLAERRRRVQPPPGYGVTVAPVAPPTLAGYPPPPPPPPAPAAPPESGPFAPPA